MRRFRGLRNAQADAREFLQPELLKLRTFPTLMGYSSRIMAESWESNMLYWAALADQLQISPAQLNVLIPEWTQKVVERIFASHLEDWPALLKSLRLVGEDVRATGIEKQRWRPKGGFDSVMKRMWKVAARLAACRRRRHLVVGAGSSGRRTAPPYSNPKWIWWC